MLNINTCTRLFVTGICRTGQIAHIFRRILLTIFFEFLNFYRTTDFTMQNVVTISSTISSIPRYETGQGFYMVWYDIIRKWTVQKVGGLLKGRVRGDYFIPFRGASFWGEKSKPQDRFTPKISFTPATFFIKIFGKKCRKNCTSDRQF